MLHLCDVSPGSLQTGSGALFDSSLSSDSFEIDPMSGGNSFSLTIYVVRGPAFFADIQDIVDPAHIEGIKKDQLRNGILSEDFFPKLNGTLQARQEREGVFGARFGLGLCVSWRECQPKN